MVDKDKEVVDTEGKEVDKGQPRTKTGQPTIKQIKVRFTAWEILVYLANERRTSIAEVVNQLIVDAGLKSTKVINKLLDKI